MKKVYLISSAEAKEGLHDEVKKKLIASNIDVLEWNPGVSNESKISSCDAFIAIPSDIDNIPNSLLMVEAENNCNFIGKGLFTAMDTFVKLNENWNAIDEPCRFSNNIFIYDCGELKEVFDLIDLENQSSFDESYYNIELKNLRLSTNWQNRYAVAEQVNYDNEVKNMSLEEFCSEMGTLSAVKATTASDFNIGSNKMLLLV